MKYWIQLLILGTVVGALTGCLRDDDEPIPPSRPISRLYISTSQFQANPQLTQLDNVYLVENADTETFGTTNASYRTEAPGGSTILYSPFARRLFQSTTQNLAGTGIQIYEVDTLRGSLARRGVPNSELFTNIQGLAYHPSRDLLFMVNSSAAATTTPPTVVGSRLSEAGATQSDLYVYGRPNAKDQASLPTYRIPFPNHVIRSVFVHDIDLRPASFDNITYVSTFSTSNTQILAFRRLPDALVNSNDSLRTNIVPEFELTLPGVTNLTSMAYSPTIDLMVATQLSETGQSRILFYEQFGQHTTSTSITPDRVIAGDATLLNSPASVTIDTREGAQYLYVADSQVAPAQTGGASGAVLRFLITDEGDVAPNGVLQINGRTPVGVSLDARGAISPPDDDTGSNGTGQNGSARLGRRR